MMTAVDLQALLATLRSDADDEVRAQAALNVVRLADPAAAPLLLDAFAAERATVVRSCILSALGFLDNHGVVPALVGILADSGELPSIRGDAAEALGHLVAADAAGALIAALDDPAPEVRFWSTFALGSLCAEDALPALRRLAASDEAVVRGWWSVAREARDAIASIEAGPSCRISPENDD